MAKFQGIKINKPKNYKDVTLAKPKKSKKPKKGAKCMGSKFCKIKLQEQSMKKNKDALGKILDFKAVRLHGMKKKKSVKTPKQPKIKFLF